MVVSKTGTSVRLRKRTHLFAHTKSDEHALLHKAACPYVYAMKLLKLIQKCAIRVEYNKKWLLELFKLFLALPLGQCERERLLKFILIIWAY